MHPHAPAFRRSEAEGRVFAALEQALGDDYDVLHHVCWVQRDRSRGARDGEADFLVVHPERGVLVLEVKGGAVRYQASSGRWWQGDHEIRDPVQQVTDAMHGIRRYLEQLPGWQPEWGPFGYAVVFPDGCLQGPPPAAAPPQLVLDYGAVADPARLRTAIERAFDYWGTERRRLGAQGAARVVRAFAHDVEIRQPLGAVVDEADRAIVRLTEQQYLILGQTAAVRRAAIAGPAGSGKTLLAVEKARRLADSGMRTLLTCFNRPLADFLRDSLGGCANVDVLTYHQLCVELATRAHLPLPPQPWDGASQWEAITALLDPAGACLGPQYHAIVVDEGQDFDPEWWLPLLALLHDSDAGPLYVFYDSNQAIYRRSLQLPEGLVPLSLTHVVRNTVEIFDTVSLFYSGAPIDCRGPHGPAVQRRLVEPEALRRELGRTLHRLIVEEGLDVDDVVVLTPRALGRSDLAGRCGRFHLTQTPRGAGDVYLSTIHRFKGLDRRAVVVAEVEWPDDAGVAADVEHSRGRAVVDGGIGSDVELQAGLGPEGIRSLDDLARRRREMRQLLYVACSRARSLLVVLTSARGSPVDGGSG